MYIEYSTAFHMKFKHLFTDSIYDGASVTQLPLIISWAESHMEIADDGKYLAICAKTTYYEDSFKVTEEFFESALQAFFIFPDANIDNEDSSEIRLEFVKALLDS